MHDLYKSRTALLFLAFCALYGAIILNLYFLQIVHHQFYADLNRKQCYTTITTYPARAPIFDRMGKQFFAMNKDSISAFICPKNLESPETLLPFLQEHFPQAFERFEQNKNNHFMYVQRRLSSQQQELINNSNTIDIKLLQEPSRYYPIPGMGPIIGITDIDNQGLFGIELQYQKLLAGSPSTSVLARDARSSHFYFDKETKVTGDDVRPVTLTIDANLQFNVYQELQKAMVHLSAKQVAAIVMDPTTGDILALVNLPDFDPNFPESLDIETTKNYSIVDTFELGSVIKIFSAMAAIEEKVVTPDEIIDCKNTKTTWIDGRKINTVYPAGCVTFSQVIEKSNNIGIAIVTKRLGQKLYDYYRKLGFGTKTGIEFLGEQAGFVNPPSNWSKQSLISLSYGYELRLSILQLACAVCVIARNGYAVTPRLILNPTEQRPQTPSQERLFRQETIDTIKDILERSTRKRWWRKTPLENYHVMSKTGTANMLVDGEYDKNRNLFTCAGIVEKDGYQRVIVVFIKEIPKKNVYAATIAAPLFDAIAEKVVLHDRVM